MRLLALCKRRKRGMDGLELLEWMEAKSVRTSSGCLEWTGWRNGLGYGGLGYRGRMVGAHRLAYRLRHGPIPPGRLVRHSCDNPPCIADAHHLLGTTADNMADMKARGRASHTNRTPGTVNGQAKVSEEQVRAIRKDTRALGIIAKEHGISKANACLIRGRKTWRHLED